MKFNRLPLYAAILLSCTIVLGACGGGASDEEIFGELDEGGGGGQTVIDPATVGTITGAVAFEGTPPPAKVINMESDPVCRAGAATEGSMTEEVVVNDGRLANVFIYISQGINGSFDPPATAAKLEQKGCRYHPHVIGVMVSQAVQFTNDDPTLHNVHATPKQNKAFNLAQATQGKTDEKTFDHEEVMVPVSCDVHGWMRSYIGVLPHPFFAVSGSDGSFTIQGVPPGDYTVTAWHETLGTQEQKVTVGQKENKEIAFSFKAQ